MGTFRLINIVLAVLLFACYAYQIAYVIRVWRKGNAPREKRGAAPLHSFAVLVCARNEEAVIGDLIASIKAQTYRGSVSVFVMADNCTDRTAARAAESGAAVYTRTNEREKGKGYAMDELMKRVRADYPDGFDAYLIFDADNVLAPDYVEEMNAALSEGHDVVTGYRNTKNFDGWIAACNALRHLNDSRYLNHARELFGTSCVVTGTGFLFSRRIRELIGDWPFHTLTEDAEFTAFLLVHGEKVHYCPTAELFDEQPTCFRQSWDQRVRWSKGYIQLNKIYGKKLWKALFHGCFAAYDIFLSLMPMASIMTAATLLHAVYFVMALVKGVSVMPILSSFALIFAVLYILLFAFGAMIMLTEGKKIDYPPRKKLRYLFTFPIFLATYIPIAFSAVFVRADWKPIAHTVSASGMVRTK